MVYSKYGIIHLLPTLLLIILALFLHIDNGSNNEMVVLASGDLTDEQTNQIKQGIDACYVTLETNDAYKAKVASFDSLTSCVNSELKAAGYELNEDHITQIINFIKNLPFDTIIADAKETIDDIKAIIDEFNSGSSSSPSAVIDLLDDILRIIREYVDVDELNEIIRNQIDAFLDRYDVSINETQLLAIVDNFWNEYHDIFENYQNITKEEIHEVVETVLATLKSLIPPEIQDKIEYLLSQNLTELVAHLKEEFKDKYCDDVWKLPGVKCLKLYDGESVGFIINTFVSGFYQVKLASIECYGLYSIIDIVAKTAFDLPDGYPDNLKSIDVTKFTVGVEVGIDFVIDHAVEICPTKTPTKAPTPAITTGTSPTAPSKSPTSSDVSTPSSANALSAMTFMHSMVMLLATLMALMFSH